MHEIIFDSSFRSFLKTQKLNFTIFDDQLGQDGDVIGNCEVSLKKLLNNEVLD